MSDRDNSEQHTHHGDPSQHHTHHSSSSEPHHHSHHHHRHHRHHTESLSKMRRRSKLKYVFGVLLLLAVFAAVMLTVTILERSEKLKDQADAGGSQVSGERIWADVDTVDFDQGLFGFDHRMESFLFVGTDNSGNEHPAEGEEYHGAMADFLLLLVMDYTDDTYGFLQIDRNTITEVEMLGSKGEYWGFSDLQICTSHWYGSNLTESAENTVTAVSRLLGDLENISGYYVLNMDDIGVLNSSVGGVEVTIEDDLTATDPDMVKGTTLTLTDEQAERYFRARMGVGGGTNVERMARQRNYMSSFFAKVGDLTRQNAAFYNQLWSDIHTVGQTNMNGNAFSRIANMLIKGENKGIFTLKGETKEGYILGDDEAHDEFYPSETAVFDVMNELYPLIPIEYEELEGFETEEETEEDLLPDEAGSGEWDTEEWESEEYEYETGIEWNTEEWDTEETETE